MPRQALARFAQVRIVAPLPAAPLAVTAIRPCEAANRQMLAPPGSPSGG